MSTLSGVGAAPVALVLALASGVGRVVNKGDAGARGSRGGSGGSAPPQREPSKYNYQLLPACGSGPGLPEPDPDCIRAQHGRSVGSKRIIGAFAALAVLTLSGCAEEKGAELPSVTSSPTATSTSPSPPVVGGRAGVPDAAKRHTRAGAEAFARYYLELVNVAWTEPDASVFDGLGDAECVYCKNVASTAQELSTKGQRFDSAAIKVRSLSKSKVEPRQREEWFLATVDQQPANIVDSGGTVVEPQKKDRLERVVLVLWRHNEWYFGDTDRVRK